MKGLTSYVTQWSRESVIFITAFLIGAFLFVAVTVYGASVIGSAITGVGTTSPLWGDFSVEQQAGQGRLKGVFVVGDTGTTSPHLFITQKGVVAIGTNTPSALFLNGGSLVVSSSTYIDGALGVANATTSRGDFIVGNVNPGILSFTSNGRLVVGATSTALTATGAPNKFIFDGGQAVFSSGGTGTTTLSVLSEANADGQNGCIEMSSDGLTYAIYINGAGSGVEVAQKSCQ